MLDPTVLVQVADEFARKKFGLNNSWSVTGCSTKKSKVDVEYSNELLEIKVSIPRSVVEEMGENY